MSERMNTVVRTQLINTIKFVNVCHERMDDSNKTSVICSLNVHRPADVLNNPFSESLSNQLLSTQNMLTNIDALQSGTDSSTVTVEYDNMIDGHYSVVFDINFNDGMTVFNSYSHTGDTEDDTCDAIITWSKFGAYSDLEHIRCLSSIYSYFTDRCMREIFMVVLGYDNYNKLLTKLNSSIHTYECGILKKLNEPRVPDKE